MVVQDVATIEMLMADDESVALAVEDGDGANDTVDEEVVVVGLRRGHCSACGERFAPGWRQCTSEFCWVSAPGENL